MLPDKHRLFLRPQPMYYCRIVVRIIVILSGSSMAHGQLCAHYDVSTHKSLVWMPPRTVRLGDATSTIVRHAR